MSLSSTFDCGLRLAGKGIYGLGHSVYSWDPAQWALTCRTKRYCTGFIPRLARRRLTRSSNGRVEVLSISLYTAHKQLHARCPYSHLLDPNSVLSSQTTTPPPHTSLHR